MYNHIPGHGVLARKDLNVESVKFFYYYILVCLLNYFNIASTLQLWKNNTQNASIRIHFSQNLID